MASFTALLTSFYGWAHTSATCRSNTKNFMFHQKHKEGRRPEGGAVRHVINVRRVRSLKSRKQIQEHLLELLLSIKFLHE